ncbi:hypothetical protein PUNSTDRAFT_133235 [Punctularia strigosozonata HHB-11173 SS5]|uniref:uncharacterized protein n=1 Tax=Punctularia strigosozonata (strain HHB-11173) TaxID=741275 RepID=UPI0004416E33|nr:uncharacterized protein PUNSTDRAFT_133235 [Punctularia strigosozonata HHB-11173 SS5]EIN10124.1 hypothetical protein PUNSTDRAFT_133235 [Punctularia strigosozonata HHB-11173 SS5]
MVVTNSRAPSPGERMLVDRSKPRRMKSKPALAPTVDSSLPGQAIRQFERSLVKAPKPAQEMRVKSTHKDPSDALAVEDSTSPTFGGPLAQAEFDRLRAEVEKYKQQLGSARKTAIHQAKLMIELENRLSAVNKIRKENHQRIENLKAKSKQSDELIATIEQSCQCQICMEPLMQPYANPCGHVFCQTCLQGWFRNAPKAQDEMQLDEDDDLVYRRKTCPTCRAIVRNRPSPLFLMKSITQAITRFKSPVGQAKQRSPPPPEGDPWEGIFRPSDASSEEDYDEDDVDDEDTELFGSEDDEDEEGWDVQYGYGTGSDEDPYEGEYIPARWAPPSVLLDGDLYDLDNYAPEELTILRRGGTQAMRELFNLKYTHEEGLSIVSEGNTFYLGWNISLHPEDESGADYVDWVIDDIGERPERWRVVYHPNGTFTAYRLVREDETEDEYETTDSEAYLEDMI